MRFSLRASVRHARPLVAVATVASFAAACRDEASITGVRPNQVPAASLGEAAAREETLAEAPAGSVAGVTVAGGPYSLRTGPGVTFPRVATIGGGVAVTVVCTATGPGSSGDTIEWYKLNSGSWLVARFVTVSGGPVTDCGSGGSAAGAARGTLVAGGPYSLRTGPGTNFARLGTAAGGTAVTVVCTSGARSSTGSTTTWARIQSGGLNTWISAGFIDYAAGQPTPPGCDSPAGPSITAGGRGDDYPYKNSAYANCANDPWYFCVRQCTSFVTWRLRDVNKVDFYLAYGGKGWGSAYKWRETAQALGYRVDRTPEVGAIAYFAKTATRTNGHVAWVASVSSDGQRVTIEEYNVNPKYGYGTRTLAVSSVDNFIHVY